MTTSENNQTVTLTQEQFNQIITRLDTLQKLISKENSDVEKVEREEKQGLKIVEHAKDFGLDCVHEYKSEFLKSTFAESAAEITKEAIRFILEMCVAFVVTHSIIVICLVTFISITVGTTLYFRDKLWNVFTALLLANVVWWE